MNAMEAVKQVLLQLGTGWILWLLAGLSLVSAVLAVERWMFYRSRAGDVRGLADLLDARLGRGEVTTAIDELGRSTAVAATIAAAGLRLADRGPAAAEKSMQSATALERSRLEQRLAYLGTLGNNAPFIGLFGTVIGIVQAFEELGRSGTQAHAGTAQVASQALMSSIAEALVATAVGIAVALPAVAMFNYLQRRMHSLLAEAEVLTSLVLAYLQERPVSGGGGLPAPSRSPRHAPAEGGA